MHQPPTNTQKAAVPPSPGIQTKKKTDITISEDKQHHGPPKRRNSYPPNATHQLLSPPEKDKKLSSSDALTSTSTSSTIDIAPVPVRTAQHEQGGIVHQDSEQSIRKRRKLNPSSKDEQKQEGEQQQQSSSTLPNTQASLALRSIIPPKERIRIKGRFDSNSPGTMKEELRFDWTAVIERAKSHPHEGGEPYFNQQQPNAEDDDDNASAGADPNSLADSNQVLTYKPLHAMLKYDPPLEAVEAVLRAHPDAALDVTFEGTALKIAAESKVSSMLVLRLLLVAEMAMRKKKMQDQIIQEQRKQMQQSLQQETTTTTTTTTTTGNLKHNSSDDDSVANKDAPPPVVRSYISAKQKQHQQWQNTMYCGHNPIRWITERRIPVKTSAMLLKWYPIGAFQRPWDKDGKPVGDDIGYQIHDTLQMNELDSPLIESVDDFARDQFDNDGKNSMNDANFLDAFGFDETDLSDWEEDSAPAGVVTQPTTTPTATTAADSTPRTFTARKPKSYQEREQQRKDRRWEKFLHVLYATDLSLRSAAKQQQLQQQQQQQQRQRPPTPNTSTKTPSPETPPTAKQTSSDEIEKPRTPRAIREARADAAAAAARKSSQDSPEEANATTAAATSSNVKAQQQSVTPFHPVHAWIRCLTSPHLGLEHCRPYGTWSVLRVMGQRIPDEFTVRDDTDGNRTVFQTLAEAKASDCKLCMEEIRDVVECLMEADYRSAFLPRQTDGRLIGHVALENGWPCKDLFSRKTSATCA